MKTWTLERRQVKNKDGWVVASFPYAIGGKEDWQNARLALNAPEMFALLQEAIKVIQDMELSAFNDYDWARKDDLLHDIAKLIEEVESENHS